MRTRLRRLLVRWCSCIRTNTQENAHLIHVLMSCGMSIAGQSYMEAWRQEDWKVGRQEANGISIYCDRHGFVIASAAHSTLRCLCRVQPAQGARQGYGRGTREGIWP